MTDVWVVNASPIIALAKVGQLALLTHLAREVLVPEAVVAEITAGRREDPARLALEAGWGQRVAAPPAPALLLEWGLGAGETAVLAVALGRKGATAVLDDAAGRTCARAVDVPVIGTLGVVLRARRKNLIPNAAAIMTALHQAGLHLDAEVVRAALRSVGEDWSP